MFHRALLEAAWHHPDAALFQGRVVEIATGALVLETELGRVRVPASVAAATTTVLVTEELEA